ncbi:hypothetical protein C0075_00025, partial [Rhizobium sp. KAs_5_22]
TAYTGMEAAIEVVTEIKAKLVAAREPGVDKDKINKELTELKSQLSSISESASFSGENWLYNESTTAVGTKEMVGSFVRSRAKTGSTTNRRPLSAPRKWSARSFALPTAPSRSNCCPSMPPPRS